MPRSTTSRVSEGRFPGDEVTLPLERISKERAPVAHLKQLGLRILSSDLLLGHLISFMVDLLVRPSQNDRHALPGDNKEKAYSISDPVPRSLMLNENVRSQNTGQIPY